MQGDSLMYFPGKINRGILRGIDGFRGMCRTLGKGGGPETEGTVSPVPPGAGGADRVLPGAGAKKGAASQKKRDPAFAGIPFVFDGVPSRI